MDSVGKKVTKTNVNLQYLDGRDKPMSAKVHLKITTWRKQVNEKDKKNSTVDYFICKQR